MTCQHPYAQAPLIGIKSFEGLFHISTAPTTTTAILYNMITL